MQILCNYCGLEHGGKNCYVNLVIQSFQHGTNYSTTNSKKKYQRK